MMMMMKRMMMRPKQINLFLELIFMLQDGFGFLKIMNSATRLGDLLDFGQFF